MLCKKHKYFVLYRGDDTDFPGNQELIVELNTTRDLTGCSAHFSFQGFTQDFAEIPSDKKLRLVIPNSATGKFALGAADAKLWLANGTKIRTVENRIHVVVTNSVDEAYDNDDPQAITVTISGGGGGATVVLDDTVTKESPNGVKSSGIWSWVKSLLPHWLTSDYTEPATVASVANKRDKDDLAVYSVTRTENTDWTWTSDNAELAAALNDGGNVPIWSEIETWELDNEQVDGYQYEYGGYGLRTATDVQFTFSKNGVYFDATATRPRYMDETLGPAKPNQQLAAVATDDEAKPANGSLMKYDAANDRFVKAVEGTDYLKTHQDISGKLDKSGGQMTGTLSGGNGFGWIMNRQGESLDDTLGTFPTYLDLDTKADRATTLAGYGITDGATKTELAAKRDLTDNVCRKTEFTEWICNPPRTEFGGVYSIRYDSPVKVYSLFDNEEVVEEIYSPTDDKLNLEFVGYCTATRSAVCSEGKKFVTSDVVDGKVSSAVSTNNPAFVSAVRNTPTENMPEDMPTDWGTYGTVGAALAALAAFVKWAKAKIVAVIGDDGKPTDQFATDLLGKQVANVKANTVSLAAAYSETETYAVGDAVTHDGKLYKCAVAITTAEAWTPAHWTETTVATLWNNADTTSYGGQN